MKSLRNVGEIRFVFDVPTDKRRIEKIANNVKGYDFQSTVNSLKLLHDCLKQNKYPQEDWQLLYDERSSDNVMSFVRNPEYGVKFYAFVWENPNKSNLEVGITYMEPRNVWLEQAKNNVKSDDSITDKSEFNDSKPNMTHNHSIDKDKNSTSIKLDKEKKKQKRIKSDIDKDTLIIHLMARVSNLLHATKWNDDYRAIIEAYPEIDNILSDIYNMNSLMKHKHRLPCELTSQDISKIKELSQKENKNEVIMESDFEGVEKLLD